MTKSRTFLLLLLMGGLGAFGQEPKKEDPTKVKSTKELLLEGLKVKRDFRKGDDPTLTLWQATLVLEKTCESKKFPLRFRFNIPAFAAEGIPDVRHFPAFKKPLNEMKRVPLAEYLEILLAPIPAPSGATFVVRKDHIEITTHRALQQEKGKKVPKGNKPKKQ